MKYDILTANDQTAIRCAVDGQAWALAHIAEFGEYKREAAIALIKWLFPSHVSLLGGVHERH